MSTSLGDPFLLSTHSLPHKPSSYIGGSFKLSNLYSTHQQGLSAEGHVVAAVQGDGLHILDLANLHPAVSYTLGPTTVFACPAVSRVSKSDQGSVCSAYAVLESVQGICPDERGRTVRKWINRLATDGTLEVEQQQVHTGTISHPVASVLLSAELPQNVLFVGRKGELTVTDSELIIQHTHAPSQTDARLIRCFTFERCSCSFIPPRVPFKQGAVVVMLLQVGDGLNVVVLGAGQSGITSIAECAISTENFGIIDASCSESGFLAVLSQSGEFRTLQMEFQDYTKIVLNKSASPFCLKGLSFISSPGIAAPLEVSVVSLGSSHVLLAGVTIDKSAELVLLLWDLQYGVLLTSRTIPIPPSVQRNKKHGIDIQLSVASAKTQQALLVVSQKPAPAVPNGPLGSYDERSSNDATQRSSILVVPYSVPPASTVANALGRAVAGEKWLAPSSSKSAVSKASSSNFEAEQHKCLKAMRLAMDQKRVEAVDEAFFAWATPSDVDSAGAPKATPLRASFSYEFVKQVLEVVLRVSKGPLAEIPYSPKVTRYLMDRRCISSNMVPGGIFPALLLRRDWETLLVALRTVIDIPEDDLLSLLSVAVGSARRREKLPMSGKSAMDVDEDTDQTIPSLSTVLALCVTYPTSPAALRVALRRHLSDAGDLTSILSVLAGWLQSYSQEDAQLLPDRTAKDQHGALVPVYEPKKKKKKYAFPAAEKIIAFTEAVLDSSFVSLLSYRPAHQVLREIYACLEPELQFADDVEQLCAPLEPFAKEHNKMIHDAVHGPEKPDPAVDWRRKRKEVHEQTAVAIGVYRVEELNL